MANRKSGKRCVRRVDFALGRNLAVAVLTKLRAMSDQLQNLLERTPPLVPRAIFDAQISKNLENQPISNDSMAICHRAGLLLWNDDLARAHALIQDLPDSTASFWHAIMHRREGDFSNAKYWWRRTGNHAAFEEICDVVLHRAPDFPLMDELRASGRWEAETFTDFCQKAHQNGVWKTECETVQRLEMKILLEWCAARI